MCSATAAPPFMLPCTQDACRPAALLGYPDGHQGALKAHLVTSTMQGALLEAFHASCRGCSTARIL